MLSASLTHTVRFYTGFGGDDPSAVRAAATQINSEPVTTSQLYRTNQGTDAHLREAHVSTVTDHSAYRLTGVVSEPPGTREGGHVFFTLREPNANECGEYGGHDDCGDSQNVDPELQVIAFEPTKNFRHDVRNLREGDVITVCGGVTDDALKLEKFKAESLNNHKLRNPFCNPCEKSMSSMGADQGYRCKSCGKEKPEKVQVSVARELTTRWYEVPPCARRHLSKPIVRMETTIGN